MKTSDRSDGINSTVQHSTCRVYRERIMGGRLLGACLLMLAGATITILWALGETEFWANLLFLCAIAAVILSLFFLREVTVDAEARLVTETWRFFGKLPVWKRQRSLREFAVVRSQRVEILHKGNRRVVCDVSLLAESESGNRLDIERFEMGKTGGCREATEVGGDLAQLTGLPFEDKC